VVAASVVLTCRVATTPTSATVAGGSWLDLGPRARLVAAAAYVLVMLAVVVSAEDRPDHAFGFQMFNESSTVNIHLYRRVKGQRALEAFVDGGFTTRGEDGAPRRIEWHDRVRDRVLGRLDETVHAKYGLAGQLFRLELALHDFASHLGDDRDTEEIVAVVETRKNGKHPAVVRLKARRR
jgi:hypothetical protein